MRKFEYRPGTADENAMREVKSYFRAMADHGLSLRGKTVLDVGAHIGCFTRRALDEGAKSVRAYEPHPENFKLLLANCPEAELHHSALVSDGRKITPLTIGCLTNPRVGTERFSTSRETKSRRNLLVAAVRCESWREAIKGIDVIKFDAEGAEYDLLNSIDLPSRVKFLVGEFDCSGSFRLPDGSMTGGISRNDYTHLNLLIGRLEDQGFVYHGPRPRLPKAVFLVHVLFVRKGK